MLQVDVSCLVDSLDISLADDVIDGHLASSSRSMIEVQLFMMSHRLTRKSQCDEKESHSMALITAVI